MKHVVLFSGGITSWATAKRVVQKYGTDDVTLLFADTLIEDEDNYRFIEESVANIGAEFVRLADGRKPWEVFEDVRFIGNARVDPCSRVLKRELLDKWRNENCDPENTILYVGLNFDEPERIEKLRKRAAPWRYEAPLMERPFMSKNMALAWAKQEGIEPPRMYSMGFTHANCGGFCCKAGQAHFRRLLHHFPDRYLEHEEKELILMDKLGSKWGIMRDRRGGESTPLTMQQFRQRLEAGGDFDQFDFGSTCGCALE